MSEPDTKVKRNLDEIIDELIISIAKTMENPPPELADLIGSMDNSETNDSSESSVAVGVELQALIDVIDYVEED